jgi:hypothetical protein
LVFEKNANFFAENCQKSPKIVIVTSTPEAKKASFCSETIDLSRTNFQNAFLSALPYAMMWLVSVLGSLATDFVRARGYLSTTATRKVANTLGDLNLKNPQNFDLLISKVY